MGVWVGVQVYVPIGLNCFWIDFLIDFLLCCYCPGLRASFPALQQYRHVHPTATILHDTVLVR